MISLDGIMQAPGGPEEDRSGGFRYGGWVVPLFDEAYGNVMEKQMQPADLLLGRKTYEIFASYWPKHEEDWPGINDVTKYVMSNTWFGCPKPAVRNYPAEPTGDFSDVFRG